MFFFAARHANRKTMKKRSGNFVRERVFARFWSRVGLELGFLLMKEERNQDIELDIHSKSNTEVAPATAQRSRAQGSPGRGGEGRPAVRNLGESHTSLEVTPLSKTEGGVISPGITSTRLRLATRLTIARRTNCVCIHLHFTSAIDVCEDALYPQAMQVYNVKHLKQCKLTMQSTFSNANLQC